MKDSKIASLLCFLSFNITLAVILYINIGIWPAFQYALVSLIALIGWVRFSIEVSPSRSRVLPQYLMSIVLLLILNTVRYASNFSDFIHNFLRGYVQNIVVMNHTIWFVWMVCLPVVILLFGGYLLSKRHPVGYLMAWWGFGYVLFEAIVQLKIELGNYSVYNHFYFIGIFISMILFYISASGILKLIRPDESRMTNEAPTPLTLRQKNLWSALILAFVAVYGTTLYMQAGFLPVGVIVGSMMGAHVAWRKTTSNRPANPYKMVPLYLLLQALFYLHVGEETLTHFNQEIATISGHQWTDRTFDYTITLVGPVIWVYGAYSLWKRQVFGNYILWFMIIGMILGEPTHLLVFPIVKMIKFGGDYKYFSGMYTALFPMIPAVLGLIELIREHKTIEKESENVH